MKLKSMCLGIAFGLFLTLSACGGHTESKQDSGTAAGDMQEMPAATDKSGPEYTSAYICPMYCPGSGSAEPGKCPKCGMDYVKNDKAGSVEPGHDGHNH